MKIVGIMNRSLNKNSFSCYGKYYNLSSALFTVLDCAEENTQPALDSDMVLLSLEIHLVSSLRNTLSMFNY